MQADAGTLKDLARRAFQARKYKDALDLYLEALKYSQTAATNSAAAEHATAAAAHQQAAAESAAESAVAGDEQVAASAAADPPEVAVMCSNIAAVLMKLDRPEDALEYATAAVQAAPGWSKSLYRQACALMEMQQHDEAAQVLQQLQQKITPDTAEARSVASKLNEAHSVSEHRKHHLSVQNSIMAAHTAWAATRAREAVGRDALLTQLQQGMAGYTWEPQDWEWRPTWTPSMRQASCPSSSSSKDHSLLNGLTSAFDSPEQQQQYMQLIAGLTLRLAELEGPQRGYQLLQDDALLQWYKQGLIDAVAAKRAAGVDHPCVLVVANGGGGLLGLLAAAAGAARVYVVEKGRWGYRAAKQMLEGNRERKHELVDMVELVPVPLSKCRCSNQQQQQQQGFGATDKAGECTDYASDLASSCSSSSSSSGDQQADAAVTVVESAASTAAAAAAAQDALCYEFQQQADILVTDLVDYSVFGQGLLQSLQTITAAGLLAPDAVMLPDTITVRGQLVDTRVTGKAAGFDICEINKYKWHPTIEKVDHSRLRLCKASSEPFQLMQLGLEQLVSNDVNSSSYDGNEVDVRLTGTADGCVVWMELSSSTGHSISTRFNSSSSSSSGVSTCFELGLYYLDSPVHAHGSMPVTGCLSDQQQGAPVAVSARIVMQQQLQIQVTNRSNGRGSSTGEANASLMNALWPGSYSWSPHGIPRQAYLPRWHFDMLADQTRNTAYDQAIRREIERLQKLQRKSANSSGDTLTGVHVLDIGTGSGLLAMMAARAGADTVTAVESVRHLAETATEIVALNGFQQRIRIVHKDGRYLTVGEPHGLADVPRQADLLAFEVFECGLIGEGALHIVAAAKASLLRQGARVLPAAAKVYCQPIQYQRHTPTALSHLLDPTPLICYGWQADYFEVDLAATLNTHDAAPTAAPSPCPATAAAGTWKPLAAPQLAFKFDFNTPHPAEAFQPASRPIQFAIEQPGVLNAVAFWFELQLDEQTTLSSNPYVSHQSKQPSTTWKQAVQLLPEHDAHPGQLLTLTASHDTYSISFTVDSSTTHSTTLSTASYGGTGSSRSSSSIHSSCTSEPAVHTAKVSVKPLSTGLPQYDPLWKAAVDNLTQLQGQLVKAMTQDPLEYRKLMCAAMLLAMRPWGSIVADAAAADSVVGRLHKAAQNSERATKVGVSWPAADPHHAAALLVRLMT